MTGRLPSITEDCDVRALLAADAAGGVLPTWVEPYVRAAFATAGYADGDQLTALGTEKARDWADIKAHTATGFTRFGAFTPIGIGGDHVITPLDTARYRAPRPVPTAIPA